MQSGGEVGEGRGGATGRALVRGGASGCSRSDEGKKRQ